MLVCEICYVVQQYLGNSVIGTVLRCGEKTRAGPLDWSEVVMRFKDWQGFVRCGMSKITTRLQDRIPRSKQYRGSLSASAG